MKLIQKLPMADYLADKLDCWDGLKCGPAFSAGTAKAILNQSPHHAWYHHPRLGGHPDGESTTGADIGTAIHASLLPGCESPVEVVRPEDFPSEKGAIPKGWTNNAIRAERDRITAEGRIPLLADDWALVGPAVDAAKVFLQRALPGIFDVGESEVTLLWREGETWCKARPDWWNPEQQIILDPKTTTASAKPDDWIRRQFWPMGCDLSAVHYLRGIKAVTGIDAEYVFLAIEQEPPHGCSLISLSPAAKAVAEAKWARAIKTWETCLKENIWPSYSSVVHYAEPTMWQMAEALENGDLPELNNTTP